MSEDFQADTWKTPMAKSSARMGRAAMAVESARLPPANEYCCGHTGEHYSLRFMLE